MRVTYFFIPIRQEGTRKLHSAAARKEFERCLFESFGGWTYRGLIKGYWRSDSGRRVYDKSRFYELGVQAKEIKALKDSLRKAKRLFRQDAIYFVNLGKAELL
jgi:hypothetical protein